MFCLFKTNWYTFKDDKCQNLFISLLKRDHVLKETQCALLAPSTFRADPSSERTLNLKYRSKRKYWDRQAWANSVDLDRIPYNAMFDQGLHCLSLIQKFLYT